MRNCKLLLLLVAVLLGVYGCSGKEEKAQQKLRFLKYRVVEKVDLEIPLKYIWAPYEKDSFYFAFEPVSNREVALFKFDLKTGKLVGKRTFPRGQGP